LNISLELPATSLTVRSNGHLVSLVGPNLALVMDGHRSPIESIEVHAPAEHSLGGATFDAELVFVAKSAGDRPVLLSLLFRAGTANAAFAPLLDQLPALRTAGDHPLAKPVELAGFAPASAPVLTYEGSLGTPPCTAGAMRLVVAQVGELSSDQLALLRQAVPRSARPPADRANRPVTLRALATPAPGTTPEKTAQP
jgi:carbonic anhydrase